MAGVISVGELRQNPTQMLRAVKAGATYTVTDHGEPVAEIGPIHRQRWVPSVELDGLLRELGADAAWERELATDRTNESITDPWESVG